MALMLPLLLVMLFVTFEGGHFLWSQHKVVKGVRDGARYAARLDFENYDCTSPDVQDSDSEQRIKNLTRTGRLFDGTSAVPGWQNDDITVSVDCLGGQGGLYASISGDAPRVTVSATVPYSASSLAGIVAVLGFDTSGFSLRAEAQSPVVGL